MTSFAYAYLTLVLVGLTCMRIWVYRAHSPAREWIDSPVDYLRYLYRFTLFLACWTIASLVLFFLIVVSGWLDDLIPKPLPRSFVFWAPALLAMPFYYLLVARARRLPRKGRVSG